MLKELGFEKTARLQMSDIERNIGTYFSDKQEPLVRRLIQEQRDKRVALKHPVATGIATLGIAPAVAKSKAVNEVTRKLLRNDVVLRNYYGKRKETRRNRELELYRLRTERDRANQYRHAASQLGQAYVAGKLWH